MRTAVIFYNGMKQIVLTPETDDEKFALGQIKGTDDVDVLVKEGRFVSDGTVPISANVELCQGDYLRMYPDSKSKILVLRPKSPESKKAVFSMEDMINFYAWKRLDNEEVGHADEEDILKWKSGQLLNQ